MNKTYKILLLIIISILLSILIYNRFNRNHVNYVAIGNNINIKYDYYDYINNYLIVNDKLDYFNKHYIGDFTSKKLISIIKSNKYELIDGHYITIQQLFRKCDLLTIYLKLNNLDYFDELLYYLTYYTDCKLIILFDNVKLKNEVTIIAKKYKVDSILISGNTSEIGNKIIDLL